MGRHAIEKNDMVDVLIDIIKKHGIISLKEIYEITGCGEQKIKNAMITASLSDGSRIYEEPHGAQMFYGWL
ncbi:MAG: hypothetical protein EOM18_15320 [Clostridia bacterium]|nr:hypothetical protein [Clostridia bacterium]